MAKWLDYSPFTSGVAVLMRKECQRPAESRGFSPGSPVSSRFPPGSPEKATGWVRRYGSTIIGGICHCGVPALVAKSNK